MSSGGSNTKSVLKNPKSLLKTVAVGATGGLMAGQASLLNDVVDEGFKPPQFANSKAPSTEDRRKRQILRAREEVIQQRQRAPGRTQTILTRRDT